ncbi:hypothetical protein [Streptomyces sp. cg40]|uniref:MmyB family transcriptional regulator n=1 Tax=Streptomyces sp. cg40 TaxID=3419764 RepID=UPI003CFD0B2D
MPPKSLQAPDGGPAVHFFMVGKPFKSVGPSKSQEGGKHLRHPDVGDLHIAFATFTVNGAPHQQLVVYQAEPASPTAAAFETLRALGAEPRSRMPIR